MDIRLVFSVLVVPVVDFEDDKSLQSYVLQGTSDP